MWFTLILSVVVMSCVCVVIGEVAARRPEGVGLLWRFLGPSPHRKMHFPGKKLFIRNNTYHLGVP
jgi:hypothetical protein